MAVASIGAAPAGLSLSVLAAEQTTIFTTKIGAARLYGSK
jgi:hypothetical protein